jgi:hypothetical protein
MTARPHTGSRARTGHPHPHTPKTAQAVCYCVGVARRPPRSKRRDEESW